MDRDARRLMQIERDLVAADPVLHEAFALWHERCGGAAPAIGDRVPRSELVAVFLMLPARVVVPYFVTAAAILGRPGWCWWV